MTKFLYVEPLAGASGDMLLGALLGLGVPLSEFQNAVAALGLGECGIEHEPYNSKGLSAHRVRVVSTESPIHRGLTEISELIEGAALSDSVKTCSISVFQRLAAAEAEVHGIDIEEVHFHEVGAADAIIDIVCFSVGWKWLGAEEGYCTRFPVGEGVVNCLHGRLPNPAPATMKLISGWPLTSIDCDKELLTPTGAALLTTLCKPGRPTGSFVLSGSAFGAGTRELPFANVVRVSLGETSNEEGWERLLVLECHTDDCTPEALGYALERLLNEGALDVSIEPVLMKKSRSGHKVWALVRPHDRERLASVILTETTSLGVRSYEVERWALPRRVITVETEVGAIRVKETQDPSGGIRYAPEYEDAKKAAASSGLSLVEVYRLATDRAAQAPSRSSSSFDGEVSKQ
ncbi:MAG: nickel pincer cofactor biosynthesis protein LarC [Candidatus Eremiobacteraeota bacterium]|nr:nickel pincer cofactor biosynthesis protein LarC [Candidatus Eremiobacteraeota bacterium]